MHYTSLISVISPSANDHYGAILNPPLSSCNWLKCNISTSEPNTNWNRQIKKKKKNPYLTSHLTQKSVLKRCSAAWGRSMYSVCEAWLCVLRRIKSELWRQTEKRNSDSGGMILAKDWTRSFTQYVHGKLKYSAREWVGIVNNDLYYPRDANHCDSLEDTMLKC